MHNFNDRTNKREKKNEKRPAIKNDYKPNYHNLRLSGRKAYKRCRPNDSQPHNLTKIRTYILP